MNLKEAIELLVQHPEEFTLLDPETMQPVSHIEIDPENKTVTFLTAEDEDGVFNDIG